MEMSYVLFFYYCFLLILISSPFYATSDRNVEIEKLLAQLNKPYVKLINSSDGDIIDCVDIFRQPAFDHPLLRNHTIQLRPIVYPEGVNTSTRGVQLTQVWNKHGSCPKGTVPILRTKGEDVLRAKSVDSYGKKTQDSVRAFRHELVDRSGHEYAFVGVEGDKYFGARAYYNVWNPIVQGSEEFSLAQIWLVGGHDPILNTIEAGWQVCPGLYGDHQTRFFIYWTSDGYQDTGCYNLKCSGFVQINRKFIPGATIARASTYNGDQFEIGISIWKDPYNSNWWLQVNNAPIGYWPSELFTTLSDSARLVEWGGEALNLHASGDAQHTTTKMGSGHFPEEGFRKAAFIRNIEIADKSNQWKPIKPQEYVENAKSCYRLSYQYDNAYGNFIYYGGPGRNPNCP